MREWREDLYARLRGHLCRVAGFDFEAAAADTDATEVEGIYGASGADAAAAAAAAAGLGPVVVAFAGKRQYGRVRQTTLAKSCGAI